MHNSILSKIGVLLLPITYSLLPALPASAQQISDQSWNQGWTYWSDKCPKHVTVNLPHDAMQAQERSADVKAGQSTAYFGGDVYHYEKTLNVDAKMLKSHVTLQFEGIYRNPQVYINGKLAGGVKYGYIPFDVCADGMLKSGANTIRIDADNSAWPNSRWYSGGGIYRPIHILVQNASAYINNVKIKTLSISPAKVQLDVDHKGGNVRTTIMLDGKTVAATNTQSPTPNTQIFTIPDAQLWSAESPTLYVAKVELLDSKGRVVETRSEEFGIRQLSWNAQQGFLVNGKTTLLKGGCLHHDEGILGACEYDDAAMRKVARLKEYGFNAIRSSHNPISPAMLRACDKLGMYIMDEMWDMWYSMKNPEDYSKDFQQPSNTPGLQNWALDITSLVRRDYNHPSVVMYSIGNEVVEPASVDGQKMEKQLVDKLHELDSSRPVTCGMNLIIQMMNAMMGMNLTQNTGSNATQQKKMTSEEFNAMASQQGKRMSEGVLRPQVDSICSPGLDMLDIAGYNYGSLRAEVDTKLHPNRIQVGTETYPQDIATNWAMVEKLPQLVGDFMWTAWDYLGEAGIGAWYYSDEQASFVKSYPWLLAGAGALDLLGNPTGEAYWAKAVWSKDDKPYIAVCPIMDKPLIQAMWRGTNSIPSWSWPGKEGKDATVEIFTTAPSVKLYLIPSTGSGQAQLIGEQKVQDAKATFTLPYQPGTLRAVMTGADGREHTAELVSATGQPRIVVTPEKPVLSSSNGNVYKANDLIYLNVEIQGENGKVISNKDAKLTITADGAEILGFGSAQPCTAERYQTGSYTTYYGQAQAILRASKPGTVTVTIKGEGLETTTSKIIIK